MDRAGGVLRRDPRRSARRVAGSEGSRVRALPATCQLGAREITDVSGAWGWPGQARGWHGPAKPFSEITLQTDRPARRRPFASDSRPPSSDNIYLHRTNTGVAIPKILDFGIAHLLLGHRFTGKYFLGTPRYAAPEQLRGDTPTARTDIYAAGLVLYELLTGEAPFAHLKDIGALLNAHLNEPLPKVSTRCAEATLLVDNVVASLLEKDPDARPPTAFAAAVILREVRSRFEASQAESMHAPEFKTEPSPMDRLLYEASPDDSSIVTEAESRPRGSVNDTIPERPPLVQQTRPLGGATLPDAPRPNRTVPLAPARATNGSSAPVVGSRAAPVDREARTRTSKEASPIRAREAHDTEPLGRDHPAIVDTSPADMPKSDPRSASARERPRGEERTPTGVAMSVERRRAEQEAGSMPARPAPAPDAEVGRCESVSPCVLRDRRSHCVAHHEADGKPAPSRHHHHRRPRPSRARCRANFSPRS